MRWRIEDDGPPGVAATVRSGVQPEELPAAIGVARWREGLVAVRPANLVHLLHLNREPVIREEGAFSRLAADMEDSAIHTHVADLHFVRNPAQRVSMCPDEPLSLTRRSESACRNFHCFILIERGIKMIHDNIHDLVSLDVIHWRVPAVMCSVAAGLTASAPECSQLYSMGMISAAGGLEREHDTVRKIINPQVLDR